MYFTGNGGYQSFLVFAPPLSSLILDNNKKVTNRILTRISSEKNKPLDTNLEPTMLIVLVDHLQKTKKEYKDLKKQEIHNIFIKTNLINFVSNMTWLMEILKI